ncbi:translesion DNA synthesis-associated protein ImuA [Paucibacter sp. M5-1]|uniref:translesion DNA synthesis-associated protein ImuA n=1 Tax=Paucibacter sp. M5-1 TaxID=3015998 RepID=UPI0022B85D79|nr:translesion DNA synthesis-associated protein ImuA [Paucibacter sp. M5-1]MCZ7880421.1 translesion DNA synthesis-associated protein ImuA [Paucibacter sp. M5-1]
MSSHPLWEDAPSLPCAPPSLPPPIQNTAPSLARGLPADVAESVWRGDALGQGVNKVLSTGFAALDAELPGGGWPCGGLTEVLQAQPSLLEWRLIGPCLRSIVAGGAAVVVIGPPKRPHLPGLRHLGIEESDLVWIQAQAPSERLWCTEQLIKANAAGAILTWLPQARPEQLRRLQVLAQSCDGPVFVCRPIVAQHDPSPAPLRLLASPDLDWRLKVRIVKRKGPAHDGTLMLPSIPGGLVHVLTPRVMQPSQLIPSKEVPQHAVGSPDPRSNLSDNIPASLAASPLAQGVASIPDHAERAV